MGVGSGQEESGGEVLPRRDHGANAGLCRVIGNDNAKDIQRVTRSVHALEQKPSTTNNFQVGSTTGDGEDDPGDESVEDGERIL